MLLDEIQIALNDLLVSYKEAADHFEDAVSYLQRDDLKPQFEEIRDGHNLAVASLTDEVRKTGILPRAQNADREQVRQIVTHVKAALSVDEHDVFLNDRIEHERQIRQLLEAALELPVAPDLKVCLEALQRRELNVLKDLTAALTAPAS